MQELLAVLLGDVLTGPHRTDGVTVQEKGIPSWPQPDPHSGDVGPDVELVLAVRHGGQEVVVRPQFLRDHEQVRNFQLTTPLIPT